MDPCELEFIGENQTIGIIPNFTDSPIHLISGSVGPFRAGMPVYGKKFHGESHKNCIFSLFPKKFIIIPKIPFFFV